MRRVYEYYFEENVSTDRICELGRDGWLVVSVNGTFTPQHNVVTFVREAVSTLVVSDFPQMPSQPTWSLTPPAPDPHDHCWHHSGQVLTSMPPIDVLVCCHCGVQRKDRKDSPGSDPTKHGPHLPTGG